MSSVGTLEPVARTVPDRPPTPRLRSLTRDALVYAGVGLLAPLWLPALVERRLRLGEAVFTGCSELLSLIPGKPGIFLRRSFYRMTLDCCATDCHIGFGTTISHPDTEIHPGVMIGSRCSVGMAVLERNATVGSNVDILSGRHQHGTGRLDAPIQDQGGRFSRVTIGRNSWVGNSAVVMADIGAGCVIGAGSVVVRAIAARSVAAGNPAVVKRTREAA
jgi:acetyltransferase-like isoleucine patch superfamily enzyme